MRLVGSKFVCQQDERRPHGDGSGLSIQRTFHEKNVIDIHEDPEVGKTEKITRFGCGALLGVVFGLITVLKYSFESVGGAVAVITGAIFVCGYLALKCGDEFWYAVFGRGR
jgi:hypothetical protein